MAIKKSAIYSSLWSMCNDLRGGMDASQYKDYVLSLLFIKYISDKYAGEPYAPITVPDGASFADMVALKGKAEFQHEVQHDRPIPSPLWCGIGCPDHRESCHAVVFTANLTPRKCLGYKTPFQAMLADLGKDVKIRFA